MLIKKENTDLIPLSVLTFFTLFFPNLLFVFFFSGENILKLIFSWEINIAEMLSDIFKWPR